MPSYDLACARCGAYRDFVILKFSDPNPPCETCGGDTYRAWRGKCANVIGDEFVTPLVDDMMTGERQVFRTKTEQREAMAANGVVIRDWHAPMPGSDKGKFSVRWDTIPPDYMTVDGERRRVARWHLGELTDRLMRGAR